MFQRPRGTRDFTPEEMAYRNAILSKLKLVAESWGYEEIGTPAFESLDLFTARSGEGVKKQLYHFKDKGNRDMVLRPELTAPVVRFISTDMRSVPRPLRLCYFGNCFRYEEPQKGRYREFWQFGAEHVGKITPQAAAEVIAMAWAMLGNAGLKEHPMRIGHVGITRSLIEPLLEKTGHDAKFVYPSIDKKDTEKIKELFGEDFNTVEKLLEPVTLQEGPKAILDSLKEAGITNRALDAAFDELEEVIGHFIKMTGASDREKESITIDLSVVRGLDYYSGIVFEAEYKALGAEKQICGGGVYDLSGIASTELTAAGFGLGFDRVCLAAADSGFEAEKPGIIVVCPLGDEAVPTCQEIARSIRNNGMRAVLEVTGRRVQKALKYANHRNATHAIIIGSDELKENTLILKDMSTGEQTAKNLEETLDILKKINSDKY